MSTVLRPISARDKDLLMRFHARLSSESRYRRYHGAKGALSRRELTYLTEVDQHDHVAIVAELPTGELAAVARVVSNHDGTAEVAVVVADDCRGMGLGPQVVHTAVRRYAAHGSGDEILALVQSDNHKALQLFRARLGGETVGVADGVVTIRLPDAS